MALPGGEFYTVSAYSFGGHVRAESFAGEDALARAHECFARAAANPDAAEVRMTRTDPSGRVAFAGRVGRERPGARPVPMTDILDPPR